MNHKKLIIYEYDSLFNILNEIKENLNFELIKAQENDFQNIASNLTSDFLIISKKNLEKIDNQIILRELPIKINKIIELINIQFFQIFF